MQRDEEVYWQISQEKTKLRNQNMDQIFFFVLIDAIASAM
jgi:hypothetical protein